jgi:hypothetical protein
MKSRLVSATVLAAGLALGGLAHGAPPAKSYKVSLTAPASPNGATIEITKASKVQIKASSNTVTFALKMNGVVNKISLAPETSTGHTLSLQLIVGPGGVTRTPTFPFDLSAGKTTPSTTIKFAVSLADTAVWGSALSPGTPIEVRRIRVIENGTGEDFGVMGVTTQ